MALEQRYVNQHYPHSALTGAVIECAMRVHSQLGPGLLESAYRLCMVEELSRAGVAFGVEVPVPLRYQDRQIACAFRADLIVDEKVLVELKSVERLLSIHDAQVLTYLKLMKLPVGLLINFNVKNLRHGIRRLVR